MIRGTGIIEYDPPRPGMKNRVHGWCVAHVDREITRYFRWWVNKHILNPLDISVQGSQRKYPFVPLHAPSWDAHISIIRGERHRFTPEQDALWRKYHGKRMEFYYSLDVHQSPRQADFWIVDVVAPQMLNIRKELGLPSNWPLHLTIGRTYIWNNKDEDY